jgi:multidrug efflux pump subunit AcrA (membrane-fusion protein)
VTEALEQAHSDIVNLRAQLRREQDARAQLRVELTAAAERIGAHMRDVADAQNERDLASRNWERLQMQTVRERDEARRQLAAALRETEALSKVYGVASLLRTFPVPFDDHWTLVGAVDECRNFLTAQMDREQLEQPGELGEVDRG